MPTVVIDGIEYVPSREVVVDWDMLIVALIDGYMGKDYCTLHTEDELDRLYDDLYIVITEDSDRGHRESLRALLTRLAKR